MKNIVKTIILTIILIALMGYVTVSKAATKQDIIDYISQTFIIAGEETYVPDEYIKEAKRYLATHEITSEQADFVIGKANAMVDILTEYKQKDAKKLPYDKRVEILTRFQEAIAIAGAKATYSNGYLHVTDENNELFGLYPVEMLTRPAFVQTGADYTIVYVSLGIIFVTLGAFVYRRKKSEKN